MPEWLGQVLAMAFGAGGVYAAIRADLAYMRGRVEGAHQRIDDLLKLRGNS